MRSARLQWLCGGMKKESELEVAGEVDGARTARRKPSIFIFRLSEAPLEVRCSPLEGTDE